MTERYERYLDPRARSIKNGTYFAAAFDLAGIDLIADYYLTSGPQLVNFIKKQNLIPRAWGGAINNQRIVRHLKNIGLQCLTYDKIDLLKLNE